MDNPTGGMGRRSCDVEMRQFLMEFSTSIGVLSTKQEQVLEKLNELTGYHKELEKRIDDLEKFRSYILGGAAVFVFLVSTGGLVIWQKISHNIDQGTDKYEYRRSPSKSP